MRNLLYISAAAVFLYACGHHKSDAQIQAPLTLQNPNFDEGLTGWQTSGNVTVVDVEGVGGFSKAAMLVYDGATPATLSQDITVPNAMLLGISDYEVPPPQGMLKIAFVQDGNNNGYVGAGGDPNWMHGGIGGRVSAGTVTVVWTMDGTVAPSPDSNTIQVPSGTSAKVTGVVVNPNLVSPGPTGPAEKR